MAKRQIKQAFNPFLAALVAIAFAVSCGEDSNSPEAAEAVTTTAAPTTTTAAPTTTTAAPTTTTAAPTTTTAAPTTTLPPVLGPQDCQEITPQSVLAPDPMLSAAGNATRDALFAAALAGDTVGLEAVYPGFDVVLSHMRIHETWTDAITTKANLTQQITRALCEGADSAGTSPGWCTALWDGLGTLNADQLAQVTQRTADEGGPLNSAGELTIEMAEFACVGSVVVITIDDAGQVSYLGIWLT